ncbi:MAG: hypothetical protein JXR59_04290 [Desulfuromonadaceae bacterium]|nr:hypothetical protein [Desulfuromonadaceae bacterium]
MNTGVGCLMVVAKKLTIRILLLPLLALATLVVAQELGEALRIEISAFGTSPVPEMSCVRRATFTDHRGATQEYASYRDADKHRSFAGTSVSSPYYDYHNGKLFRVRFDATLDADDPQGRLQQIERELTQKLSMKVHIARNRILSDKTTEHYQEFTSEQGQVAQLVWKTIGSSYSSVTVKILSQPLLDRLNRTMNPRYAAGQG